MMASCLVIFFFFNDTATTEIYTLSLHDALPILPFQAQVIDLGKDNNPARKLQIAEMAIKGLYVDKVDEQKLVEDGIRGMLEKLDPHSSYSTAKETKAMNEPLQGSFDGIGVQFNIDRKSTRL